jgi:type IV secretory pathway VirB10-like protein
MPKATHAGATYYGEQGHVEDALGRLHELDPTKDVYGADTPGLDTTGEDREARALKDPNVTEQHPSDLARDRLAAGREVREEKGEDVTPAAARTEQERREAAEQEEKEQEKNAPEKEETSAGSSSETSSGATASSSKRTSNRR